MKPILDFDEYIRQGEPDKREKASIWQTAIGLQAVDGLQTSNYQKEAHITKFVSGIWQIHAFGEGNTRTTAVFTIQYLRSIGFEVNNDLFARYSWYFRNALVRANYKNAKTGIDYSQSIWSVFFVICCMANNGIYATDTCIFTQQPNGAYSLI